MSLRSSGVSAGKAIKLAARELGVRADDLGAVILQESGGNPHIWGGEGGKYAGVIQFGPNERKAYGWRAGMSFAEQVLGPMLRFFKDRFATVGRSTQGASLLDLYRTVLGGNPKASINGPDANGTTPGNALAGLKKLRHTAEHKFGLDETAGRLANAGLGIPFDPPAASHLKRRSSERYAALRDMRSQHRHHHSKPVRVADVEHAPHRQRYFAKTLMHQPVLGALFANGFGWQPRGKGHHGDFGSGHQHAQHLVLNVRKIASFGPI